MKTLICLLLAALALTAGDLTGKWNGKFDITNSNGETKPDEAYMTLKLEGTTVTGTAGPNVDQQWAIKDGKLEGRKLTFQVITKDNDGNDGPTLTFDLDFDGDTIRGSATGNGDNGEKMTARLELKRLG